MEAPPIQSRPAWLFAKKMVRILLGLVPAAALIGGAWWYIHLPMFTIEQVNVGPEGTTPIQHEIVDEIKAAAINNLNGNFFTVNLEKLRSHIESVPWVRSAYIRRQWPNKLIISIEEHEAAATWGDQGEMISKKGELFVANIAEAEESGPLPEFHGPEGTEKEILERFLMFRKAIAPLNLYPVEVKMSPRHSWSMVLNNDIQVELGRDTTGDVLKERLNRLVENYPHLADTAKDGIKSFDLRYQDGIAVKMEIQVAKKELPPIAP